MKGFVFMRRCAPEIAGVLTFAIAALTEASAGVTWLIALGFGAVLLMVMPGTEHRVPRRPKRRS
jgi:hypothetical protein